MPYVLSVDPERRLVVTKAIAPLSLQDVDRHRAELAANSDFTPDFDQILDLRGSGFVPELKDLRRLVSRDPFADGSRRAVLVDSVLQFGVARSYNGLRGDDRSVLNPFQSLAEACDWIGIPVAVVAQALGEPDQADEG